MAEKKRCAIYTRKSTEDGLEQDFNSLDAQKEACAAYILSQAAEGWEKVGEHYDDGGWSGGSMDRPALKQLLADVAAGKVDIIVVYKVDRLTRSLADFAKIVEILDKQEASFVSVTQAFNTTISMGRLTLNVLLSFAQFEREVTSERIRDKVAASKKKGMWMGGPVPLGYRVEHRMLHIEPGEAETIRFIFDSYCELRSVQQVVDALDAKGARTKLRKYKNGKTVGGCPFTKGMLALMLRNPIYSGRVRHNEEVYEGQHEAIIPLEQFEQVQSILKENRRDHRLGKRARNPSLLTGMISDPDGRPMSPSHTTRRHRCYRYYMTRFLPGETRGTPWSVPAGELEKAAVRLTAKWLRSNSAGDADEIAARGELATDLKALPTVEQRAILLEHDLRFELTNEDLILGNGEGALHTALPAMLVSRGAEKKLQLPPDGNAVAGNPDPVLIKLLAQARSAQRMIMQGSEEPTVVNYSKRHLWQLLRIGWLAPDITTAIIEGRQPVGLTGRRLLRASALPLDWAGQRTFLGFS
ncbi:recombinase family protein [Aurantiacibacter sp. MUD11]|uniref:recombinase family protein n=1 Tax=Aurantiacibacter sp. MUD11 TaxID=3003265 RepID=UPI0022AA1448|nr:recombinase family protein [Aurantiacibacter sp. MUD11]WAT19248.1 recombinase family protein [Aurantiacibacter sp. MUD11]